MTTQTENQIETIGSFKVTSGKIFVGDPCYDRDAEGVAYVDKAMKGKWVANIVRNDDGFVTEMFAMHVKAPNYGPGSIDLESVFVDSGHMGIYEDTSFPDDCFYDRLCEIEDRQDAYVLAGSGFVSRSGYGDGEYDCVVNRTENGYAVCVTVVFIRPEMEED